jgi:hypothetical protein
MWEWPLDTAMLDVGFYMRRIELAGTRSRPVPEQLLSDAGLSSAKAVEPLGRAQWRE